MERMRELPCPSNNQGCKYFPNCHDSVHHVYPRRTVETPLQKKYSEHPRNKLRACRNIHDLLDTLPPPSYPNDEAIKRFLGAEALAGAEHE